MVIAEVKNANPNNQDLATLLDRFESRREQRNHFFHNQDLSGLTVTEEECVRAFCDLYDLINQNQAEIDRINGLQRRNKKSPSTIRGISETKQLATGYRRYLFCLMGQARLIIRKDLPGNDSVVMLSVDGFATWIAAQQAVPADPLRSVASLPPLRVRLKRRSLSGEL